ncbi:MAG TPA: ATP-dependent DNA helicase, partial [Candidatus Limnocylindrales bacterium]|nr:ATP-dependent DNA helicase [Candidatus Limnocylindrales bacterium]
KPEVVIFLRERLFELDLDAYRPLGDPTRFLGALAAHFSRCKDEDISPAAYLACADRLVGDAERLLRLAGGAGAASQDLTAAAASAAAERQLELARAYARYQSLLGEAGLIDFGDQVSLALRLLRESPVARHELQRRYRYILVDEFQDTNRAQAELVAVLAEGHRNVTVVGDDDQSIYRFRGAAISNILEFRGRYRRSRLVVLRRNYRSRAEILAASHRLIRHNDPDRLEVRAGISKELRAQRPEPIRAGRPPAVRHEAFATGTAEADWIATEIQARITAGARPRDHAVLVRTNAGAGAILRSLNMAGVGWRFSGTSGLYARPEIKLLLRFLRTIADLGSSIDLYGLAASEVYGLDGPDLTAIMAAARRRNRSLWDVLEELDRQPGILRIAPATRTAVGRLVGDLRTYSQMAHERPCGEVLYAFLKASGVLAGLAATNSGEEALQNIARFFEIVRGQSALLPDDRAIFVARHLQTLIDAGDEPPTAEIDAEEDLVSVLTVHKAKGLEFPTVFLAGLVEGRFPTSQRRDGLEIPDELVHETIPAGDHHLQEERRLFFVGMTRARDELILTHAADYGGRRARRVSPFVLEALDLPIAALPRGAASTASGLERLAAATATEPAPTQSASADRPPSTEPLSLSFYQVDDYLTCPQKYKFNHILRVPVSPHHSIIYGAALHRAVQEFHKRHARGEVMSEAELCASFEAAWSSEGFLNREHELARLDAGRAALRRFRSEQLQPGAVIPAYVERDFAFSLDGDRIRGRWDRVDVEPAGAAAELLEPTPGEPAPGAFAPDVIEPTLALLPRDVVTITDYKSSDVRDPDKARQKARDSLQLTIYAMGWQAMTGRLPDAVQLSFLETGLVGRAGVDDKRLAKGRAQIQVAARGIRARDFTPTPDMVACSYCPFRDICPASAAR